MTKLDVHEGRLARALTTLFGNGAVAFGIGKNSVISTKIGKKFVL